MIRQFTGWVGARSFVVAILVCLGVVVSASGAERQAPTLEAKGRQWALLIGVEKYHRALQLRFTVEDARQLAATLRTRGAFDADHILEMTDQATNPRHLPLRTNLETELPAFLQQLVAEDTILIFFSGHGFRDAQGKMYLAPLDCDPANPAATGISVQWLREQLAACKARFKLLILDACHAGSEKGDDDKSSVAANDLGEPFKDLEGVVTLASSTADQKSQIWEERKQSLFSYWLNQGLRGHADETGDGAVDIDELYKYVYRCVTATAKAQFPLVQSPVRIVRSGVVDVPAVLTLKPQGLRQVLADMAEILAIGMQQRQLTKVGVLEFTNDTRLGELLGADFGLLGRYCAEELERRLMDQSNDQYRVVDRRHLQKALAEQDFMLADLGSLDALKGLSSRAGGMPVIALGTLRNRAGRLVTLQCKLVRTDSDELAGSVGGVAVLNESEWAMLGRSVAVKPEDRRPAFVSPGQSVRPAEDQVIDRMDQRAEGAHPLLDPNFPFKIRLMIGGQQRKGVFRGNDLFIPVHKGEVYEIWVDNPTQQIALMRLLVDGLNTLPEPESTKGVQTVAIGKRVSLEEARHWELDPALGTVFAVRGFVTEVSMQGKLREFVIVDADQSLAARQKFTDQIGLITAAFYAPAGGSRRVGTGLGKEREEEIQKAHPLQCGNLLAVVHLRYVETEALEQGEPSPPHAPRSDEEK